MRALTSRLVVLPSRLLVVTARTTWEGAHAHGITQQQQQAHAWPAAKRLRSWCSFRVNVQVCVWAVTRTRREHDGIVIETHVKHVQRRSIEGRKSKHARSIYTC
jgi:hypothetical protein